MLYSVGNKGSNIDTGYFDGHDLGDSLVAEATLEFQINLLHPRNVYLMVQEAIHLQDITGLDDPVFYNSLFKKILLRLLPSRIPVLYHVLHIMSVNL